MRPRRSRSSASFSWTAALGALRARSGSSARPLRAFRAQPGSLRAGRQPGRSRSRLDERRTHVRSPVGRRGRSLGSTSGRFCAEKAHDGSSRPPSGAAPASYPGSTTATVACTSETRPASAASCSAPARSAPRSSATCARVTSNGSRSRRRWIPEVASPAPPRSFTGPNQQIPRPPSPMVGRPPPFPRSARTSTLEAGTALAHRGRGAHSRTRSMEIPCCACSESSSPCSSCPDRSA